MSRSFVLRNLVPSISWSCTGWSRHLSRNSDFIMGDSDSDSGVPDSATAQKLVKEFEHVTNTDEILAQYHLQEHGWDLSKALNTYFAGICAEAEAKIEAEEAAKEAAARSSKEEIVKKTAEEALKEGILTTKAPANLVFMSWNIDGLDEHNLKKRTKGVCKIIEQEKADIVFLQEVIPMTFSYIESKLTGYQCLGTEDKEYFVATLLRKGRVYLDRHTVVDFPTSRMGRHVLAVQAHCGNVQLDLFNTHLESTAEHAEERKNQLKKCLEQVKNRPGERVVILAGDLNMRDKELDGVGGLPRGLKDVWQECGSRKEAQYTWDMIRNSNLQVNFGKFRPRCRFDRIYLKDSTPQTVKATNFGLVGLQKITGTQSFPSDHWGLRVALSLKQELMAGNQNKKLKTEEETT